MSQEELSERVAEYAHTAWSGWMGYAFAKGTVNPDGSVTIPAELVERWKRQINTSYSNLPENEKESDRAEANKMLDVIEKWRIETARKIAENWRPNAIE